MSKTQYVWARIGLSVLFFMSGYAVGYGVMATLIGRGPLWLLLAAVGGVAYWFFLGIQNRLVRLWEREKFLALFRSAYDDALAKALAERERKAEE